MRRLAARGFGLGSATALVVIHLLHVAGVAAAPVVAGAAAGFLCHLP
jgi:hypothetical protein